MTHMIRKATMAGYERQLHTLIGFKFASASKAKVVDVEVFRHHICNDVSNLRILRYVFLESIRTCTFPHILADFLRVIQLRNRLHS